MGDWVIVVEGQGAHNNKDYPNDANLLAADFLQKLRETGHTVFSASFTSGGRRDLIYGSGTWGRPAAATESGADESPAEPP